MKKRAISIRTLILAVAATAIVSVYLATNRETVQAQDYLSTGRYQFFPASDIGIKTAGSLIIFDSHQGIVRQWDMNTVTTYEFADFQKIPEKRIYRQR